MGLYKFTLNLANFQHRMGEKVCNPNPNPNLGLVAQLSSPITLNKVSI